MRKINYQAKYMNKHTELKGEKRKKKKEAFLKTYILNQGEGGYSYQVKDR